jgi:branched-chain amino acid transport system substrate-binding protein
MRTPLFMILAFAAVLVGCSPGDVEEQRVEYARNGKGDLIVGVAWSFEEDLLGQGVQMAADEINAAGGVRGRKLVLKKVDDQASVTEGRFAAQSLVDDPRVVAVIGHQFSYVSLATAPLYEFSGVLMMSPSSTSPELSHRGYRLVFRNIPSDADFGAALADYAAAMGYRRVFIYYVHNDYGRELANHFEARGRAVGVQVADRLSYDESTGMFFHQTLRNWKEYYQADALFLAATMPQAAQIIRAAGEVELDLPIFGSDGLDSPLLPVEAGDAAAGTVIASVFHRDLPTPQTRAFIEAFKRRYDQEPDVWAAQGYDALKILAHAMEKAKSAAPEDVAATLRSMQDWPGVGSPTGFTEDGNVTGKAIVFKRVNDGRLDFLAVGPEQAARAQRAAAQGEDQ